MTDSVPLDHFHDTLERSGVQEGLHLLNDRVPHRYTAVYQLEGNLLRNLYLHDKQGEVRPEFLAEVDMGTSFCQFVLRDGCFLTDNSAFDTRLDGHPYQGVMVAYHGVPLLGNDGRLTGTLCHFDTVPRGLSNEEFAYLQRAARVLPAYVPSFSSPPGGVRAAPR